jgi:hypothetical protein
MAALGKVQDAETIYRCFNCHATGVKPGPNLDSMLAGVTCDRCHAGSTDHALRPGQKNPSRPRNRSAVVVLCGECHRLPDPASAQAKPDDPFLIRFAPVGLMASRCFRKSSDLSCTTCHNPHEDVRHDNVFYASKCIGCHVNQPPACKANVSESCIGCHMPKRSPAPYLVFTDHRIGLHRQR